MNRRRWAFFALAALLLVPQAQAVAAGGQAAQLAQATAGTDAAYVRGIQKELRAHGYQPGPVDGVAGTQTRAAIRAYQGDAGLEVDGKADKRLLDHLKFALPKVYTFGAPVMGSVLDVQRALADRGYYLGPQDGRAGPTTYRALDRFQRDAGRPPVTEIDSILAQQIREAPAEVKVRGEN